MVYLDYASTYPYVRYAPCDDDTFMTNPNANYAYAERSKLQGFENRIKTAIGVKQGHILYFRTATDCIEWLHDAVMKKYHNTSWGHSLYEHDCCLYGDTNYSGKGFWIQQLVNHITGDVWDLPSVRLNLNWHNAPLEPYLIVDATATIGKTKLPDNLESMASALFMSGHKISCPSLSFLWVDDDLFKLLGGNPDIRNQYGLKHGSISVCEVCCLTDAIEDACLVYDMGGYDDVKYKFTTLSMHLYDALDDANIKYDIVVGSTANCCVINAVRLRGFNADSLQQYLSTKGIYIGIGHSSCAGNEDYRILEQYGLTKQEASEVIRVSFCEDSKEEEIDEMVKYVMQYKELYL